MLSSQAELVRELSRARVPLATWQSEDIRALWNEIKAGDAVLAVRYGTTLVRKVHDVRALVRFERLFASGERNKRNVYTLVETARISDRGARRSRPHTMHSLSTQMQGNETPLAALQRLLRENLGIRGIPRLVHLSRTNSDARMTLSGLMSEVLFRLYEIELSESQFKPDGYVSADASIRRFEWKCSHHVDGPTNNGCSRRHNIRPRARNGRF
ncbi:MAG: hypothetical protein U1A28_05670 [Patescibacteria group bacterium]|nr:hypothetical protein [Patescibacteria group bacterium]